MLLGLGVLAAPVALIGLARLWRRDRAWAVAGMLIVVANGAYTAVYAATDTQPYWLVGLVIIAGWLGLGLATLAEAIPLRELIFLLFILVNLGGEVGQMVEGSGFAYRARRPWPKTHPPFWPA